MATYKTVQLPDSIHRELNDLKIQLASSIGSIPSNGTVIHLAIKIATRHYDELISELRPKPNRPKPLSERNESE